MPTKNTPITVAQGAGIGPETIEIGEKVYLRGNSSGLEPTAWDLFERAALKLVLIDSRGPKVYRGDLPETLTADTWRCRSAPRDDSGMQPSQTIDLLGRIPGAGVAFIKIESLDGQTSHSLGQGQ